MTYVPTVRPMSYRTAETLSEALIEKHFPELLVHPGRVDVLETLELLVDVYGKEFSVTALPNGVEGRTWPNGNIEISETTYVGAACDDGRSRFTITHECQHSWHHSHQIQSVLESGKGLELNRRSSIPAYRDPEWQANALASAFLMPLPALKKLSRSKRLTPPLLMDTFGVSFTAATIRLERIREYGVI